jgi:hypothetical protein
MNIGLDLDNLKVGDKINFDANTIGSTMAGQGPLKPELQSFTPNIVDRKIDATSLFTEEQIKQGQAVQAFEQQYTKPIVDSTKSLLTPPDASAVVTPPDPSKTFIQKAGDELKNRYNFDETPLSGAAIAASDIQEVSQIIDPETLEYGSGYSTPVYMGTGSQDMDVMVPTAQRNFNAYSNMGQYGSTSRIYDTILMNPVSTWSRDLSSRFS